MIRRAVQYTRRTQRRSPFTECALIAATGLVAACCPNQAELRAMPDQELTDMVFWCPSARQELIDRHQHAWTPAVQAAVREGRPAEGMTVQQLRLAMGYPSERTRRSFAGNTTETWIYKNVVHGWSTYEYYVSIRLGGPGRVIGFSRYEK